MNTKIKLLITLTMGMYFFTGCNNGSTTTTEKDTDSAKNSDTKSDTMDKKMNMDNMKPDNAMMTSMNKMMDNMSGMKMSGDFDMDFANMMIEHHQGAIDMSEQEFKSGKDDGIKEIAKRIITNQTDEQAKLRDIVKNLKPMKMDMGKHDELTKEMEAMKAERNNIKMSGNIDKDFAMMMISHHESAVKMAKAELSHGMNTELKKIAQKEINDQTKEISEFKSWLSSSK